MNIVSCYIFHITYFLLILRKSSIYLQLTKYIVWLCENAILGPEDEKINKLFVVIKLQCVQTAPYLFPHNFCKLHIAVIYLLISILLPCRHYLLFLFFWLKTTEIYCLTLLEIKVQN